jgi:hypothetical protein
MSLYSVHLNRPYKNLIRIFFLLLFSTLASESHSQYKWKFVREKDSIKVYESETATKYKAIKVECVLQGTYDKLIAILNDVSLHKRWVYNNKLSYILKRNSIHDFYYYTETIFPWPMSNRDAVIHLTMKRDSLDRFLQITAVGKPNNIPEKKDIVRVPRTSVTWWVTRPTVTTIKIVYTFDADPGGSVPSWLVNSFADKGPLESFKKLSGLLKE